MAAKKKALSTAHKKAMQKGREEGRIVRAYLEALRSNKPKRGRKRTTETAKRQLAEASAKLADGVNSPTEELLLVQRKLDLEAEVARMSAPKVDMKALEAAFIKAAKSYGTRHGISRAAWRKVGVPAAILKRAGL